MNSGSGPGQIQRIAATAAHTRAQTAYRVYLDHSVECTACRTEPLPCAEGRRLAEVWKTARREAR
ncbi:hypothetical protein [Streptomyces apocyni]|uniref:hypothetical protein n=1 Tax=Streptomyces apocyni TaxID=2654677 RepID=UPI0012EA5771|nr:hypothetical protein [Streptomyces apocyni]